MGFCLEEDWGVGVSGDAGEMGEYISVGVGEVFELIPLDINIS